MRLEESVDFRIPSELCRCRCKRRSGNSERVDESVPTHADESPVVDVSALDLFPAVVSLDRFPRHKAGIFVRLAFVVRMRRVVVSEHERTREGLWCGICAECIHASDERRHDWDKRRAGVRSTPLSPSTADVRSLKGRPEGGRSL